MPAELPDGARVVIIGGGVAGCSVAYHLAKFGCPDVLLLERRQLTCGTTWHAAGLVGQLRATLTMTRIAQYTAGLYAELEAETGQATGFKQNGSISVATTDERFTELKRAASSARTFGLEVEVLTPEDIGRLYPILRTEDLVGGVHLPKDGQTNPIDTTRALAAGARRHGARIVEGVKVLGIVVENGRTAGVVTGHGPIRAEAVVNCAGMWAREVAALAGVRVPLLACEHFYAVTEPIPGLDPNLPVLRDPDGGIYVKEDAGKLLFGCFEKRAKPWGVNGIPEDFCFDELPEDMEHFMPSLERALHRIPLLDGAGIRKFFNGPESFTPDNRYYLGEAPELPGFFVMAGFNSTGIQSAGGAGRLLAEWVLNGRPGMDASDVDILRAMPEQSALPYLQARVGESLGLLYDMHWPHRQYETARGLKRSPFHDRLAALGACHGETATWERPNWYAPPGTEPVYRYSWGRQNWFEHAAAEHRAVREGVGLFDLTSFTKILVQGPDAEAVLQRLSTNDVGVPGRVAYTQWLNAEGGIEADLTVMRLGEDRFLVVTSASTRVRDMTWLRRNMPEGAGCTVADVTGAYAVLGVMGPRSRALLAAVSGADLSEEAFAFGTCRPVGIGLVEALAARISYAGELGWELYVPAESALPVLDAVLAAGEPLDLRPAGYHALDSLRLEKGYRHWGHDIGQFDTPLEAGLAFCCRFDKPGGFIGRDALLRRKEQPIGRRLLHFRLLDPEPLLYRDEPIRLDGRLVGRVTSGAYGHCLG
ncbi:MAG: FAD-dependent oxidoreductase, partial [Pseudomonadota bacterium]|nr:FAD-dependent oxidoreductase [Pseudomonadota bacterium]